MLGNFVTVVLIYYLKDQTLDWSMNTEIESTLEKISS
jgi:hypothetical protein